MRNAERVLFSLIQSELCGTSLAENIKESLTPELCEKLYILSNAHGLSGIVYSALSKEGVFGTEEIEARFKNQMKKTVCMEMQREYAIRKLQEVLEKENIPYVLLKGAVIRTYYPKAWQRTSCDVDVLVQKKDTESVIESLCRNGFIRCQDHSAHDCNLLSPNQVKVELHYTLTQDGKLKTSDKVLERVWEYMIPEHEGDAACKMETELFILYHLAHMGRHLLHGGCGIRSFLDLWLIEHNEQYDKDKLNALLQEADMMRFYTGVKKLCGVWMENQPCDSRTEELARYIISGGTHGSMNNVAKVSAANGDHSLRFWRKLIFLSRTNLVVLYPKLKRYPILLPFYQVKRWMGIFDRKRYLRLKYRTKARANVEKTDGELTKKMLHNLGL